MGHKLTSTVAFRLSKAGNLDANPMAVKNKAASALAVADDGTTFVTLHEGGGLSHYLVTTDEGGAQRTAFGLAQAMAARSDPAEVPNLAQTKAVAWLEYERGSVIGSNTQAGAEISTVVSAIATSLQPGEWVAATVRRPSRGEMRSYKRWTDHRGVNTHHSLEVGAVVTALWAGGNTTSSARGLLKRVSGSLPGFDLRTRTRVLSTGSSALPLFGTAALAGAVGFLASGPLATIVPGALAPIAWVGGAVALLLSALVASGRLPSRATRVRSALSWGSAPAAGHRKLPPSKPRKASVDRDGNTIAAQEGDYPLVPSGFLMGALLPLSIIAPHAGAESGVASTKIRTIPPVLLDNVGPVIGKNDGSQVHLSTWDGWQGLICLGQAGSGKSAFLHALWGYDMLAKQFPPTPSNAAGPRHAMIAIDTKGDGLSANEYASWARAAGGDFTRIDFADEDSQYGIELFPTQGSAVARSRHVVNALRYVYGEDSIGPESFDTLTRVITAALVITDDMASQVEGVSPGKSPFYYANILLSNRGDDLGVALAAAVTDKASRQNAQEGSDLYEAAEMLKPIYDPHRTVSQRAQLLKAPRTKVAALMVAEHWWSRPMRATWETLITNHQSVIINTGKSQSGTYNADDALVNQMSALIMYSLHEEIKRLCAGWFESGQMVSIYADELKHIAGTSADVVSWIRNDARSFGVRAVFATQYPEQLDPRVRDAVMGFGTLVTFAQQNPSVCQSIVASLTVDGSEWTTADVYGLPQYEAIVRTSFHQSAQTAFTMTVPDFKSMRGEPFAVMQGLSR